MTAPNPALNFDSREPRFVANPDASPMFPAAPIYARTSKKKATGNLPLLVGVPVMLLAVGALAWTMMSSPGQTPAATQESSQLAVDDSAPLTTPLPPETAMPTPVPAPYETAAIAPAPLPAAAAPAPTRRAAVSRRTAPAPAQTTTPDAGTAAADVSATVAAPAQAPTPAAIVAEPAPLVIPAPTATAPAPAPVTPIDPM